jgi:hypothetical protein
MQRLGRAAIFTFGAAVAAGTSGCAMNTLYGAAPDEGIVDAVAQSDSGNDAGLLAHYGGPPVDADVDAGGSSSDYGAPPPRDAGVDS